MSNLSSQQQSILKWLINRVRYAEQHNRQLLESGFAWAIKVTNNAQENSRRASLCRALGRLEKRGLIQRIKGRKQARTIRLMLTDEGRKLAEALTTTATTY